MGNYVANADALVAAVTADAENATSRHDMGGDIAPYFVQRGTAGVYDFLRNDVPGSTPRDRDYWRDVGTLDAYYEANTDLIAIEPVFNLYNDEWPLFTGYTWSPPPSSCTRARGASATPPTRSSPPASSSPVPPYRVRPVPRGAAHSWAQVTDSVLMDNVQIERYAQVHRAIIDKNVVIPERARIGLDREHDLARGFTISDSGITVVPKGAIIEPD